MKLDQLRKHLWDVQAGRRPRFSIDILKEVVQAKTRKLPVRWTLEMPKDDGDGSS